MNIYKVGVLFKGAFMNIYKVGVSFVAGVR